MSVPMRYRVSWYEGRKLETRAFSNLHDAIDCFRTMRSCLFVESLSLTCIDSEV